jgi:tetratricopeptide (TPR) repeat protein
VLAGLEGLVDKSLLQQDAGPNGEPRFRLLETIREYALERLEASGEADDVRRRHARHCLALAERAEPELRGPAQAAWLDRLEVEHDNLRAALRCYLGTGGAGAAAGAEALRLGAALWRFWQVRGHVGEGRRWLAAVLALPAPPARPRPYLTARAEAAFGAGILAGVADDTVEARARIAESLALSRELGDEEGGAWALFALGELDLFRADLAPARGHAEQSAAVFRRLGSRRGLAWSLLSLGLILGAQGDAATAQRTLRESEVLFRDLGESSALSILLSGLGALAAARGDVAAAWPHLRESLVIQRTLVDRSRAAWTLEWCAGLDAAEARAVRLDLRA